MSRPPGAPSHGARADADAPEAESAWPSRARRSRSGLGTTWSRTRECRRPLSCSAQVQQAGCIPSDRRPEVVPQQRPASLRGSLALHECMGSEVLSWHGTPRSTVSKQPRYLSILLPLCSLRQGDASPRTSVRTARCPSAQAALRMRFGTTVRRVSERAGAPSLGSAAGDSGALRFGWVWPSSRFQPLLSADRSTRSAPGSPVEEHAPRTTDQHEQGD